MSATPPLPPATAGCNALFADGAPATSRTRSCCARSPIPSAQEPERRRPSSAGSAHPSTDAPHGCASASSSRPSSSKKDMAKAALPSALLVVAPKPRRRGLVALRDWLEDFLHPLAETGTAGGQVRTLPKEGEDEQVGLEELEFQEAVGVGSFGAVWRGAWRGEVVAIKRCKLGHEKYANMLLKEIQHLQRLRHTRLVSFLGCSRKEPYVYMIMEYLPGGSLYDQLFKRGRRPEFRDGVRMGWQIAEGLTYLHQRNVVHRDLKTANVVLDSNMDCKICDFGLTMTLERSHEIIKGLQGTARYMAPEQFEVDARISLQVDVWALGCALLEILCFTIPFKRCQHAQEVARELLKVKRAPAAPGDSDPLARTLIQACLRLAPEERPSAPRLEEALGEVWRGCLDAEWAAATGASGDDASL